MMRIPMSKAASALFRAILARGEVARDRILLSAYRSTDWQSLTLIGECHQLGFRIPAPEAEAVALRISEGIEDALSVHEALGLGAWAAGACGFMPPLADIVPPYAECVTVFAHSDHDGCRKALELADRLVDRGLEVLIEGVEQ